MILIKLFNSGGRKIWKKSYGMQYTEIIPGTDLGMVSNDYNSLNLTACIKKCIQMTNSRFAKRCSKNGGYFKCCVDYWGVEAFEDARNKLIRDGLIKDTPTNICNDKSMGNPCLYCSAHGVCTHSNPHTGAMTQTFYPNKTKPSKGK